MIDSRSLSDRITQVDRYIDNTLPDPRERELREKDPRSRLEIQKSATGVTVISFLDRDLVEEASLQLIGDELTKITDALDPPRILLSFENVEQGSSTMMGILITINTKIRMRSGQLAMCSVGSAMYNAWVITKLNKLFSVYDTLQEALVAMQNRWEKAS